jgi:DnaJ-class molecular chaperone
MKKQKPKTPEPEPTPDRRACPSCSGSGVAYSPNGTDSLKCAACNGQGFVSGDSYRSVNDPETRTK